MRITSVGDLDRLGLRDVSALHPDLADLAGRSQLAIMAKYPTANDTWRRWVSVDSMERNDSNVFGVNRDTQPAFLRPYTILSAYGMFENCASHLAWSHDDMQDGFSPPTDRPERHTFWHEGLHAIGNVVVDCRPVRRELGYRINKALGILDLEQEDDSPEADQIYHEERHRRIAQGLSNYAAASTDELIAEALSEWNEYGYKAGVVAIAVGTTVDRYLSRGAPGAERALALHIALNEEELEKAITNEEDFAPRQLTEDDIPEWKATYAEFYEAVSNGGSLPAVAFRPLDMSGLADFELHEPIGLRHLSPGESDPHFALALQQMTERGYKIVLPEDAKSRDYEQPLATRDEVIARYNQKFVSTYVPTEIIRAIRDGEASLIGVGPPPMTLDQLRDHLVQVRAQRSLDPGALGLA